MVLRTTNAGVSWTEASPDLSTKNPSRGVPPGGIVGDSLGRFYGEVVFSIAPSDVRKGLIWTGTNDGKVWYTKDAGKNWNDVTKNITGLPAWGVVSKIERFDAPAPASVWVFTTFHERMIRVREFPPTTLHNSGGIVARHVSHRVGFQ